MKQQKKKKQGIYFGGGHGPHGLLSGPPPALVVMAKKHTPRLSRPKKRGHRTKAQKRELEKKITEYRQKLSLYLRKKSESQTEIPIICTLVQNNVEVHSEQPPRYKQQQVSLDPNVCTVVQNNVEVHSEHDLSRSPIIGAEPLSNKGTEGINGCQFSDSPNDIYSSPSRKLENDRFHPPIIKTEPVSDTDTQEIDDYQFYDSSNICSCSSSSPILVDALSHSPVVMAELLFDIDTHSDTLNSDTLNDKCSPSSGKLENDFYRSPIIGAEPLSNKGKEGIFPRVVDISTVPILKPNTWPQKKDLFRSPIIKAEYLTNKDTEGIFPRVVDVSTVPILKPNTWPQKHDLSRSPIIGAEPLSNKGTEGINGCQFSDSPNDIYSSPSKKLENVLVCGLPVRRNKRKNNRFRPKKRGKRSKARRKRENKKGNISDIDLRRNIASTNGEIH